MQLQKPIAAVQSKFLAESNRGDMGAWTTRHSKQAQRVMYPIRGFVLNPLPSLNIRASITSITDIRIILREVLVVRLLGGESVGTRLWDGLS